MDGLAVDNFKGLQDLKVTAQKDANKAMPEVAKQFEAIFLQAMLKSMRQSSHFLNTDSPFRSDAQEQFQEMLDSQYAQEMGKSKGIGLAEMLTRQLTPATEGEAASSETMDMNRLSHQVPALHYTQASKSVEHPITAKQSMVEDFVKNLLPMAKKAASLLGLDPKMMIAQAALETGWGSRMSQDEKGSSYNLFNIKAHSGEKNNAVEIKTTEYVADTPIKTTASFRRYANFEQSLNDYVSLVKHSERYQGALANAANPSAYIKALHKAGFATDPHYSDKVMAVYDSDALAHALDKAGLSEIQGVRDHE